MLCSICKKNTAIIFSNKKNDKGEDILEGFCYECAKEKGINPLEVLSKQSSILEGDKVNLEDMTSQFESIFKDLTESLSDSDINIEGINGAAIPLGTIFGVSSNMNNSDSNTKNSSNSTKKVKTDKKNKQKKTRYLDTYGTNLTTKAKNYELDAVIGRDNEIRKNYSNIK